MAPVRSGRDGFRPSGSARLVWTDHSLVSMRYSFGEPTVVSTLRKEAQQQQDENCADDTPDEAGWFADLVETEPLPEIRAQCRPCDAEQRSEQTAARVLSRGEQL